MIDDLNFLAQPLGPIGPQGPKPAAKAPVQGPSFADVFKEKLDTQLKLSTHAQSRLTSRQIQLSREDWDRIHRVNAKGVFFCLQRVAREMIPRRSGRIINIASVAGKGFPGTSNAIYAASKGAVISLTKTAAAP